MWKVINSETGRTRTQQIDYTELIRDSKGRPFVSKLELVDNLNDEFISAAERCGAPVADCSRCATALTCRSAPNESSLRFARFTPGEIFNIVTTHIANKSSQDIYGISAQLLKLIIPELCYVLTTLYNTSIKQSYYPTPLKKVKISPLYKGKGSKHVMKSYRPISLVPGLSKIFEVGLNQRLLAFMSGSSTLSDRQYAYCQGRSTTALVREVVWRVLSAKERHHHVALVCCDLSRAFDTANHALIASKLHHYGIRGPALNLISSFMSGRSQVVVGDYGDIRSSERSNAIGVPQGSCLSNTLFTILLNDLPTAVNGAEIYMYADDVAAVVTALTADELNKNCENVVHQLNDWFRGNGLALNLDKTCLLSFSLGGRLPPMLRVGVGGFPVSQVSCTRLLGFELDSALKWDAHIEHVCSRLGSACFALRRLAATASKETVRSCYFATVHAVLSYGTELWARAANRLRAFRMQKRAVRTIVGIKQDESVREHFRSERILTLTNMFVYQVAVFVHGNMHMFKKRGAHHQCFTRNRNKLTSISAHTLKKSTMSVYVVGPSIYNKIPDVITNAASTAVFKNKLKMWLMDRPCYDFDEFINL